jgi:hypothetical protein
MKKKGKAAAAPQSSAPPETLVQRYGLSFGPAEDDHTSAEERRVLAKVAPSPQDPGGVRNLSIPRPAAAPPAGPVGPFAQLDAHLLGTMQCIAKGEAVIRAMGEPDPLSDPPRLLRDKQMLQRALADFVAFKTIYEQLAPAVWNRVNEAFAHAPQMIELNGWLRSCSSVRLEFVHPYTAPPTGPYAYNVVSGERLFSGWSYSAITFEAKQARVWATHNQADHLILLHALYHFWEYAEKAVDIQIGLDRDMQRGEESFFTMWTRWMGKTNVVQYASASLFGKNVVHLRRILNSVLSILAPAPPGASESAK